MTDVMKRSDCVSTCMCMCVSPLRVYVCMCMCVSHDMLRNSIQQVSAMSQLVAAMFQLLAAMSQRVAAMSQLVAAMSQKRGLDIAAGTLKTPL